MAPRATRLGLATGIVLAAMFAIATAALACDGAGTKTASAKHAGCDATHMTACTQSVTATTAAQPARTIVPSLLSLPAPAVTTAFPSLPRFRQPEPIVAGLMAYIDPETGMLCGPIGDLQVPDDLSRALAAPVTLTPVTLPDGSVMVDLQGTLQDYYILTVDPLGRRRVRCVQDPRQAATPVLPLVLPIAER